MGGQKKFVIAGIASILLVAAVVGIVVISKKGAPEPTTSSKAVQAICAPTYHRSTCELSLYNAKTDDPKELMKLAFQQTVKYIGNVLEQSTELKEAETDPSLKGSYGFCERILKDAVEEMERTVEQIGDLDSTKTDDYIFDVKVWLSAALTSQETCIDAFQNTPGDAGKKMSDRLKKAKQMTTNALDMMSDISSLLGFLKLGSSQTTSLKLGSSQRLLSAEVPEFARRRLLQAARMTLRPTIVVAQDGSGQFKTLGEAVASLPKKSNATVVIYVKAGLYAETVEFPKKVNNVMLVGDGPLQTRITGKKNVKIDGLHTNDTATIGINGEDFFAMNIGIENTAGPAGEQAVALRVSADKAVFFNVAIDAFQDTLYVHKFRQYFRDCYISGTVDFVFGNSLVIFQNCLFTVRKPGPGQQCMITAQGREYLNSTGALVIQNGTIAAEPAFLTAQPPFQAFLGRPWKPCSRTLIMQSNIEGFINPAGWAPWNNSAYALDTLYYGEYQNRGAGSNIAQRVKWRGIQRITPEIANQFTGGLVYGGDEWVLHTGVPYVPTLMRI